MAVATELTLDDFEKLPDALAHNHELIAGELVDVSGNSHEHVILRDALFALLWLHVLSNRLGRVCVEQEYAFGENAHGPDISFFGPDKESLTEDSRRVQPFVPDLAIEFASKNDTAISIVIKANRYRRFGTAEVCIFFAETREVHFYSEQEDRILRDHHVFKSELIPGFQLRLADLFDRKFAGLTRDTL
jgi:Uma2 family endonuclease